jgi:uncharacterized lipoprotein YddW (UPF0748 family)
MGVIRHRRPRNPYGVVAIALITVVAFAVGVVAVVLVHGTPRQPGSPSAAGPAGTQPVGVCGALPTHATRDLRGMTLTTVLNIDFPSKPGLSEDAVKAEYLGWLDVAQRAHLNAIFVHIRPSGDAFWPSQYAPWSEWLTGNRSGAGPGWDPLAFMVEQAHARNIEFYGWMNPYRGGQPGPRGPGGDINNLAPNHPLRAHPDWAIVYPVGQAGGDTTGSRLYFDPGNPDARTYVEDSMLEAVQNYDLDGVFFDDYFYPYPENGQDFNDDASYAKYGNGMSRADWRRSNVDTMVREMSQRIKAIKPWVKFGISPFGIWRNLSNDPAGSDTKGLSAYDTIYADSRTWVQQQWVDYIVPQLYWSIGNPPADYAKLVAWWSKQIAGTRVQLYTAHADYRIGESGAWSDPGEIDRQLTLNGQYPVSGSMHYTASYVRSDPLGSVMEYVNAHYAAPALPPIMAQLPVALPPAPTVTSTADSSGITLHWASVHGAHAYAVFRYASSDKTAQLVGSVPADATSFTDKPASPGSYGYCVSGLDRAWNQGPASAPTTATL